MRSTGHAGKYHCSSILAYRAEIHQKKINKRYRLPDLSIYCPSDIIRCQGGGPLVSSTIPTDHADLLDLVQINGE